MVVTEIDCHNCDGTFKVDFDVSKNGNHVVKCPKCGHEHCRVIEDGKVTSARWDSRNQSYQYGGYNYFSSQTSSTSAYCARSWSSGTSGTDSYVGGWTERRPI